MIQWCWKYWSIDHGLFWRRSCSLIYRETAISYLCSNLCTLIAQEGIFEYLSFNIERIVLFQTPPGFPLTQKSRNLTVYWFGQVDSPNSFLYPQSESLQSRESPEPNIGE